MGRGEKGILGNEEKRALVMAIGNLEGIHGGEEDDQCFWFSEAERERERDSNWAGFNDGLNSVI